MEKYVIWNFNSGYRTIKSNTKYEAEEYAEGEECVYIGEYEEAIKDAKAFIEEEEKEKNKEKNKDIKYALIPVYDKCELHEFDGTFDEGESFAMGEPVKWKNPKNTRMLAIISGLDKYDKEPMEVLALLFKRYHYIDRIYLNALKDKEGWYNRESIKEVK